MCAELVQHQPNLGTFVQTWISAGCFPNLAPARTTLAGVNQILVGFSAQLDRFGQIGRFRPTLARCRPISAIVRPKIVYIRRHWPDFSQHRPGFDTLLRSRLFLARIGPIVDAIVM